MKRKISLICLMMMVTTQFFAQEVKIPDYSQTERKDIPVNLTWKIDDIYPSMDAWSKDKELLGDLVAKIEPMSKNWTAAAKPMLDFMKLTDDIAMKFDKLYSYVALQSVSDLGNTEFQALKGSMMSFYVSYSSQLSFINEDILNLGSEKFAEYLKQEPGLQPYKFNVEKVLRMREHILPSDQQRIVSLSELFGQTSSEASSMLNNVEMPAADVTLSDGSKVSLNIANYVKYRSSSNAADRSLVMNAFWKNHKKFENTFAVLINGQMQQDWFNAKVRKYNSCLDASLDQNNIDAKVYTQLIQSVRGHLGSLHRYMTLKKQLLGLDTYKYDDIYASAVKSVNKLYSYDEAVKLIVESMAPLGTEYGDALKKGFAERWVDIYPNKGKESGAFSNGVYGVHPYVKMNYNGQYDAVSTLAHELGHSMHSFFSCKEQAFANHQYATFLAEIASTFNENMLMQHLLETETDDLFKLYILDRYLDQVRSTIFRQTLFAEFELAMHQQVEQGQSLTADWLSAKYLELTRLYYGHDKGICIVDDYIADEWSWIPHFYMGFYVYQYSTGIISSMALSEMVLSGQPGAKDKYLEFLSAGGSDYPLNILKKAGVDMTTSGPTDAAFNNFDRLVSEMETIVARLKKDGKL